MGRCSFPRAVSVPARGAGEASETSREQRTTARHRSFRPPWGHPRYPARDGGAERLVLFPKRPLERGFFVRHDEDVEGEPEQRAVDDEAPIAYQHRLTQDDGNDRDVYWITHITVETGHHEIPGRRDGRGGAETLQRETRKCVNEPGHACENHCCAEAARQLTASTWAISSFAMLSSPIRPGTMSTRSVKWPSC